MNNEQNDGTNFSVKNRLLMFEKNDDNCAKPHVKKTVKEIISVEEKTTSSSVLSKMDKGNQNPPLLKPVPKFHEINKPNTVVPPKPELKYKREWMKSNQEGSQNEEKIDQTNKEANSNPMVARNEKQLSNRVTFQRPQPSVKPSLKPIEFQLPPVKPPPKCKDIGSPVAPTTTQSETISDYKPSVLPFSKSNEVQTFPVDISINQADFSSSKEDLSTLPSRPLRSSKNHPQTQTPPRQEPMQLPPRTLQPTKMVPQILKSPPPQVQLVQEMIPTVQPPLLPLPPSVPLPPPPLPTPQQPLPPLPPPPPAQVSSLVHAPQPQVITDEISLEQPMISSHQMYLRSSELSPVLLPPRSIKTKTSQTQVLPKENESKKIQLLSPSGLPPTEFPPPQFSEIKIQPPYNPNLQIQPGFKLDVSKAHLVQSPTLRSSVESSMDQLTFSPQEIQSPLSETPPALPPPRLEHSKSPSAQHASKVTEKKIVQSLPSHVLPPPQLNEMKSQTAFSQPVVSYPPPKLDKFKTPPSKAQKLKEMTPPPVKPPPVQPPPVQPPPVQPSFPIKPSNEIREIKKEVLELSTTETQCQQLPPKISESKAPLVQSPPKIHEVKNTSVTLIPQNKQFSQDKVNSDRLVHPPPPPPPPPPQPPSKLSEITLPNDDQTSTAPNLPPPLQPKTAKKNVLIGWVPNSKTEASASEFSANSQKIKTTEKNKAPPVNVAPPSLESVKTIQDRDQSPTSADTRKATVPRKQQLDENTEEQYDEDDEDFTKEPWYFDISKEEATVLMKKNSKKGVYLTRPSQESQYVLMVRIDNNEVKKFKIQRYDRGWILGDPSKTKKIHESLSSLMEHYKANGIKFGNTNIYLKEPLHK